MGGRLSIAGLTGFNYYSETLKRYSTMSIESVISISTDAAARLPYETPVLILHGDVRDLTMGGTTGVGDSGNTGTEEP